MQGDQKLALKEDSASLAHLNPLLLTISSVDGVSAILQCLAKELPKIVPCEKVGFCTRIGHDKLEYLELAADSGETKRTELPLMGSSLGQSILQGAVMIDNQTGHLSVFFDSRELFEHGFEAFADLPLVRNGKVFAALRVAARNANSFRQREEHLLELLRDHASNIFYNAITIERLADTEKIFGQVFENSHDAVFIVNPLNGAIAAVNSKAEELTGKSRRELLEERICCIFTSQGDADALLKKIVRENTGKMEIMEYVNGKRERGILQITPKQIHLERGMLLELSCKDVTKELEIKDSYTDLMESISDIVLSLNDKYEFVSINDGMEKILGYGKTALVGTQFASIVYDADLGKLVEAFEKLRMPSVRNVKSVELRLYTAKRTNKYFEFSGKGYYDSLGNLIKVNVVLKDIDESMKGRQLQEMLSRVLTESSDAVFRYDQQGRIQSWNGGANRIFGYSEQEVIEKEVTKLYPPGWESGFESEMAQLRTSGKIDGFESTRMRKDGTQFPARISANTLRDQTGKEIGYVGIVKDLSDKETIRMNAKEREELERRNKEMANEEKRRAYYISSVSHELRTPLTNIHGYSQLLFDEIPGKLNIDQKGQLQVICNETTRLTKLINDILDFSKLESNKFKLNLRYFDLRDLESKCSCLAMAERKGLYVNWELGDEPLQVYGDPNRIAQVFINLISNSIKFTEKGGITVRAERRGRKGKVIRIEVTDTGAGIAQEEWKNIFKKFYQVGREEGKSAGTGLGLTISREIVKLHGGEMGVTWSEKDRGTTIEFTLRTEPKKKKEKRADKPGGEEQQLKDAMEEEKEDIEDSEKAEAAEKAG
ncbi:Methanogenesis regulatory histidine kinase FilI [Candidatus Gugararchaeum adminiculabundum]|nr:Methanogenesis regulatory histidine kinase FilI [Candidatus Gugararchaeum adminiculabundum]